MNVEFEEFDSVEELFLYMACVASPMKNILPINSYKGYICSIIPLSHSDADTYLMVYTKGTLENGIKIMVPPFINSDDKIVLDTRTLEYIKKIK